MTPSVLEAQITGSVFRDYNANGIKDTNEPFVSGITVTAYGSSGTACGTTTTSGNSAPNYSLTGCGTAAVRVEFSIPSSGSCANSGIDFTALGGTTYGSSVQFVTGNSTNVHFAINNPADYTASTSTPKAYIPCYVGGNPLGGGDVGTDPWFVGFPYSNSGTTAPTLKLDGTTVGATWGVAYSKQAQKIFTSAFVKRHVGLGSMGSGGIYMLTPTASSFTVTQFYDMDAHGYRTRAASGAPAYGEGTSFTMNGTGTMVTYLGATDAESGAPVGLGVIGNNGGGAAGTDRELPATKNNPSYDPAAFDQVGKVSLGGLEISDDGKFLFVVNLYDRKVYRLELNDAANPTSVVSVTSYALPSVTVNNGVLRPFANKFYKGKLYVGAVTTGENGGQNIVNGATDLYAYVFELENATGSATFNSTPTITYPLNYRKGEVELIDGSGSDFEGARWLPWTNNTANAFMNPNWIVYPSPMLSDLDFTERGDLMMAFTDRGGHQWGNENYINLSGSTQTTIYEIGGDLLIAGKDCTTGNYTLESNGSYTSNGQTFTSGGAGNLDGPGGGEFFNLDKFDPWHYEIGQGAVTLLPGQDKVLTTVFDPIAIFSGGTVQYSLTDGTVSNAYQLYVGTSASDNGKSNGLGDLELSSTVSPIEIGNRVWNDNNNNGIQDAGEGGIGNVAVELYADFDNDGTPDIQAAGSPCADNTTATGATVSCGGTTAWTNPNNATTVNATNATAALAVGTTSHCLQVTGLGFAIPTNATITGVTATITRSASAASKVLDNTVQLLVGGVATGTNKATATTYTTTLTAATYGGSSDLWGTTLTPAQVNATNFGINFSAGRTGTTAATARVDAIQVNICYSTPAGTFVVTTTTATTGNIGSYYFNTSNVIDGDPSVSGNQAGLAPNKKYLIRIGSADWTGGTGVSELANLALTTTDATPTAGLVDASDNDAVLASTIPTIAYTTGSYGQNDHTLDFGFFTCIKPSGISFTKTTPTCTNGTANNNGKITLTAVSNADKYGISTGATYIGVAYASATTIGTMPFDVQTAIPTAGATYTIRFFNGLDGCYKDTTVVFYPITCASCPKPIMYLCGTNKPNDGVAFDHGLIDYLRAIGHTVTPASFDGGNNLINVETTASINTISNFDKIVVSHSAYWEVDGNFDNILDSLKATSTSVLMLSNVAMNAMGLSVSANYEQFIGEMWIDNNTNSILPSGLSNGSLSVYNSPATVGLDGYAKIIAWGDGVGSGAIVGAYRGVQPDTRATYFGYPKGANLANNTAAPGRRFFLGALIEGASALGTQIDVANPNDFFTANGKKY